MALIYTATTTVNRVKNTRKATFRRARYYHDYPNPLHTRIQHVFPTYLLTLLLKTTLQHKNMISYEMIKKMLQ